MATGPLPEVDEEPATGAPTFEPAAMFKDAAQFEDWADIKERMKEGGEQLEETILQQGERMAQAVADGLSGDEQVAHDEL